MAAPGQRGCRFVPMHPPVYVRVSGVSAFMTVQPHAPGPCSTISAVMRSGTKALQVQKCKTELTAGDMELGEAGSASGQVLRAAYAPGVAAEAPLNAGGLSGRLDNDEVGIQSCGPALKATCRRQPCARPNGCYRKVSRPLGDTTGPADGHSVQRTRWSPCRCRTAGVLSATPRRQDSGTTG